MRTIRYGKEYWKLHDSGYIERPGLVQPSESWRVTGAVTRDNFGHPIRYYSLKEILEHPELIPWLHKNGKQKTFIRDHDHGSSREWHSPNHHVS